MSDDLSFRTKSIISLIMIIGISVILLVAVIIPNIKTYTPPSGGPDVPSLNEIDKDISEGKKSGKYCLSASETWNNVGKTACVAFTPVKCVSSKGYWFLDEKANYKKGFVAFLGKKNMANESTISNICNGNTISVYGEIVMYEGHPEIKVYNLSQITRASLYHCRSNAYGCVYKRS